MKKKCLVPGTFDPVTVGHFDIVERVKNLFDEVRVAVFDNSQKKTMYTPQERFEMLRLSFEGIPNVSVDVTDMLMVDYAEKHDINIIVKGVRNMIDFDYEYQLSLINREMKKEIETFFLPSRSEHLYVSSTFVRELIRYKKDFSKYVPIGILEYINRINAQKTQ